jgi:hypothetical protein
VWEGGSGGCRGRVDIKLNISSPRTRSLYSHDEPYAPRPTMIGVKFIEPVTLPCSVFWNLYGVLLAGSAPDTNTIEYARPQALNVCKSDAHQPNGTIVGVEQV